MSAYEWVPGENCDVILAHYKHEPVPLVCYRIPSDPIGPRVRIHFETYWPTEEELAEGKEPKKVRHLWFTILTTDEVLCPDGGWYPYQPWQVRQMVHDILQETTDISLYTPTGLITGLYSDEHAIIDTIYQDAHTIEINLTTLNMKDTPIGPGQADMWLPENMLVVYSKWNTAVWR